MRGSVADGCASAIGGKVAELDRLCWFVLGKNNKLHKKQKHGVLSQITENNSWLIDVDQ